MIEPQVQLMALDGNNMFLIAAPFGDYDSYFTTFIISTFNDAIE